MTAPSPAAAQPEAERQRILARLSALLAELDALDAEWRRQSDAEQGPH